MPRPSGGRHDLEARKRKNILMTDTSISIFKWKNSGKIDPVHHIVLVIQKLAQSLFGGKFRNQLRQKKTFDKFVFPKHRDALSSSQARI
jgi:hypothetical protein